MVVTQTAGGLTASNSYEKLDVMLCSEGIVHVVGRPVGATVLEQVRPWMLDSSKFCTNVRGEFQQAGDRSILRTAGITVELSAKEGSLRFKGRDGKELMQERSNLPRTYEPSEVSQRYRIV
jgi:hypothetical protein